MKALVIVLAVIWAQFAHSQTEKIVLSNFAGKTVKLFIPRGYCVIERDSPLGALHYQMQADGNKGKNTVAVLFADCKEWTTRLADNSYRLRHHGSYLFQLTQGEEQLVPFIYSREDYIQNSLAQELRSQGVDPKASRDEIDNLVKKRLKESNVRAPSISGPTNLGLIYNNEQALFYAVGMTLEYPNETPRISGVFAATLVAQVPTTINLYADYDSKDNFSRLLAQQKKNVASLLAANR